MLLFRTLLFLLQESNLENTVYQVHFYGLHVLLLLLFEKRLRAGFTKFIYIILLQLNSSSYSKIIYIYLSWNLLDVNLHSRRQSKIYILELVKLWDYWHLTDHVRFLHPIVFGFSFQLCFWVYLPGDVTRETAGDGSGHLCLWAQMRTMDWATDSWCWPGPHLGVWSSGWEVCTSLSLSMLPPSICFSAFQINK